MTVAAWTKITGTNPAANTEISETVGAGFAYALIAVTVALVQGLTQTPLPVLVIDDGADLLASIPGSTTAQAASTTCQYTWGRGLPLSGQIGAAAAVNSTAPLPEVILREGYRIRTVTAGKGANSDYGAPTLWVASYGT